VETANLQNIGKIAEIITNKAGISVHEEKFDHLNTIVNLRLLTKKLEIKEYIQFLENSAEEIDLISSFFTIHETCFYRNKEHYNTLKYKLLPDLIKKKEQQGDRKIILVSAGCSTGEEPSTIAMLLVDLLNDIEKWNIQIIAIDINIKPIETALKGEYSEYKLRNLDFYYIQKYFKKINNKSYLINENIKKLISYRQGNLNAEPFLLKEYHDVDIIFCENVIIYFDIQTIQKLISNFHSVLSENGVLFLGYSETLQMFPHLFEVVWNENTFFYQKKKFLQSERFQAEMNEQNPGLEHNPASDNYTKQEIIYERLDNQFIENLIKEYCLEHYSAVEIKLLNYIGCNPRDWHAYIYLAECYLKQKKYFEAMKNSQIAISLNANSFCAHLLLGIIYLEVEMPDFASYELQTALLNDSQSLFAYFYLAKLNFYQKDYQKHDDFMRLAFQKSKNINEMIFPLIEENKLLIYKEINEFYEKDKKYVL